MKKERKNNRKREKRERKKREKRRKKGGRWRGKKEEGGEEKRRTEVPEEKVPVVECLDCLARIASKETCNNSFCEKWHPPECLFYKTKSGCLFGEKCSYAHRQVDEQPTKRSKKNDDKSAVALLKKGD